MRTSCRILHVEDSPDDAELVRFALREAPFSPEITRVDVEADYVAQLDAGTPDVILCDYDMPRFSAERALAILRERGLDLPFIVVSHHIDSNAAVVAMQQGAGDYLPKRNLGRLVKAIEAAIDRSRARAERARAEEALRVSESMKRGILDALTARIALLDAQGTILAVNRAWEAFDGARPELGPAPAGPGTNYLAILEAAAGQGNAFAGPGIEGIRSVIEGKADFFALEYHVTAGASTRWYQGRVTPLPEGARGAVVSHEDITGRMMAHIALDNAHRRLQVLSKRVLSIQEDERRSISRELHDDVGQTLAALKIGLHRLAQGGDGQASLVDECLAAADASLERLRHLAHELRPPQLDQLGLEDALGWLAERQRIASGLAITCAFRGLDQRRPPPAIESACYRIAQEALNNATRHAHAKAIHLGVEAEGRLLKLTIRDDGVGFDEEVERQRALKSGSMGLVSMEERAQLAGGRLKLRSVPGGGTTLSVIFPLDEPA